MHRVRTKTPNLKSPASESVLIVSGLNERMQREPSGEHLVQGSHAIKAGVATEGSHLTYPLEVKVKPLSCVQLFATPWPTRLLRPLDFPGKNTGVGCHFLLQGIFPAQGSNSGLPHCRQTLYPLRHQGLPSPLCLCNSHHSCVI